MSGTKHAISIWFFIGALLTIYGVMILGSGIYYLSHPLPHPVVLSEYRAELWWGVMLLVLGIFYCVKFPPGK
ncbi:MAG TPA: hypothetical protein DEH78_10650 [Solibacterales bacterium]|nr:hypothetical protein [Bryobacterales bacterium]